MIIKTSKAIATNPIARAVAKKKLEQTMLTMRIKIMLLENDEPCQSEVMTLSDGIFIMAACYEMMGQQESPEFRKLRSALSILTECSERDFLWQRSYAVTIDNAIQICVDNWTKIPIKTFWQAAAHVLR